jgi:multidrug resistance efflux pump
MSALAQDRRREDANPEMENLGPEEKLRIQLAVSELVNLADSKVEMGSFLGRFLRQSVGLLDGVGGTVWILRGNNLDPVFQEGVARELEGKLGEEIQKIPSIVLEQRKPYVASLGNHAGENPGYDGNLVATYVMLESDQGPLGILQVIKRTGPEQVVYEEEVKLLQNLARIVSLYLTNVRLPKIVGRFGDLSRLFSADREIFSSLDPLEIAYKLANVIPELMEVQRCTVATYDGDRLVIRAISGQDTIDSKSVVVKRLTRLLAHAATAGEPLFICGSREESFDKVPALRGEVDTYFQLNPFRSLYTFPIEVEGETLGLLCLESTREEPFLENDRALVELFSKQGAVALRNARLHHSIPMRVPYEKWLAARRWVAETPRVKVGIYFLLALVVFVGPFVWPVQVRVGGDVEVAPVQRTFARSKVDGVLREFKIREGEQVRAGQVVALLDDEEPQKRLREAAARAEILRASATKYHGVGQIAEYEVEKLKLQEVQIEIELLRDMLGKARILAESEGTVLTPQPRMLERIGKPVVRGEEIIEVGDLNDLILQAAVPEEDISWVKAGHPISFILNSLPERRMETKVALIHPKAEVKEKGNFFIVDAELSGIKGVQFKPGMKGTGKVYGEERSLAFVFFRRLLNFVRIHVLF